MFDLRFCVCLIATALVSATAIAKNETLAERGKRMCDEAGVALEDCTILPPGLRSLDPDGNGLGNASVAETIPVPRPDNGLAATGARFGTGKYGWCDDCTSLLAAAPVTPWETFGGWRNRSPHHDEDGASDSGRNGSRSADRSSSAGERDRDRDNNGGDNGDDDNGDSGDDSNEGGEICN